MKRIVLGLLLVFACYIPTFAEERLKLEGFNDITENINGYQITKADIIILGVEFYKSGSHYFKHCYNPMILNFETPNSFAIDFAGFSEWHNETRKEYTSNDFKISISFDLKLWPTAEGRLYGTRFIPTKISNSKTTFKGKFTEYSYPTNSAYGDYVTLKEVPETTVGPYEIEKVDYKKGFDAKCDSSAKYHDIPIDLKSYAQNIIMLESRYLNEKSLNFQSFILDDDGNKTDKKANISISCDVYAVLNSLTLADGTTKTFNTEKIDEKDWVSQNSKYDVTFPWEGEGTSDSPFLIKNANDLLALATNYRFIDAGFYFKQESDIAITNNDYWGKPEDKTLLYLFEKPFTGHYDGNGKSINGLKIITTDKEIQTTPKAPYNDCHGLFHRVRNAEIKNLTIDCEINIGENNKAGALAGEAINSTFSNIAFSSKINGKEEIGGLVGEADNVSFNDITVNKNILTGKKFVGGVLGKGKKITANNIKISNSVLNGGDYVGGAFGGLEEKCNISDIEADVAITAIKYVAGAIGIIKDYCSAKNIFVSGNINAENIVGGVFGEIYANTKKEDKPELYSNFVSKANIISSKGIAGGIVGQISNNAILSDCINYGTIIGKHSGGIASIVCKSDRNTIFDTTIVERCINHGTLKFNDNIKGYRCGGIAADLSRSTIKDCYNDANVESKEDCGGIVGYSTGGNIQNCYSIGELKTETYDTHVGGIAGGYFPPTGSVQSRKYSVIKDCFITSDTKFVFNGKPLREKNATHKCIGEEPTYKESFSNLQKFNSVSDIKLDSSWNPDVWEINAGAYPKLKMANALLNKTNANTSIQREEKLEEKPFQETPVSDTQKIVVPEELELER